MRPASASTGRGADTRRFVVGLSGAVARNNTTPTKNTKRPSRSRSRTEEELRRQGHDLDATQESSSEEEEEDDESSSEEEENNPRTGVPSALLADIEHSMSHEALLQLPIG